MASASQHINGTMAAEVVRLVEEQLCLSVLDTSQRSVLAYRSEKLFSLRTVPSYSVLKREEVLLSRVLIEKLLDEISIRTGVSRPERVDITYGSAGWVLQVYIKQ